MPTASFAIASLHCRNLDLPQKFKSLKFALFAEVNLIAKIKIQSGIVFMNDDLLNENKSSSDRMPDKVQVSIDLDSEVLEQIEHLTNDPSRVIEAAIKQWLRGERSDDTDLTRTFQRNPPVPPQGEWND